MRFYAVNVEAMEQQREERLRHQLEIQSMQIEGVFERHQVPSRVAGGQVGPGWVRFDLQTSLAAALERLQHIKDDLLRVLAVTDVNIERKQDRLQIQVAQPTEQPVNLLDLLAVIPPLPPMTAALGWSEDDRPVVIDLTTTEASHVLIAGTAGSGKTVLLRSIALSLALNNKPSQLQLVIVDGDAAANATKAQELAPLNYLPHILTPVIDEVTTATEVLAFLVNEINYRQEQGTTTPAIAILIDGASHLLQAGGNDLQEAVRQLVKDGDEVGMHVLLSTNDPGASYLDNLLKAQFPARIVGKVNDSKQARAAAGITDSQAEYLLGAGDFMALAGGSVSRFQAGYIGGIDLLQTLEKLHRRRLPVLLAQTTSIRPKLEPAPEPELTAVVREFVADAEDDEISFLDDIE